MVQTCSPWEKDEEILKEKYSINKEKLVDIKKDYIRHMLYCK